MTASPTDSREAQALPPAPRAWARSVQFFGEAFLELFGLIWLAFAFTLVLIGVGIWILPGAIEFANGNADRSRALARRLTGVHLESHRRPVSGAAGAGQARHTWQQLKDPEVQRNLLWHLANPVVGMTLGIVSLGLVLDGIWGLASMPFQLSFPQFQPSTWFTITGALGLPVAAKVGVSLVLIALEIVVGVAIARPLLRAQGAWAGLVLRVDDSEQWRRRTAVLEATRADALDLEQAELQRIERDLHDGAQMRFVSTGLTITEAARLVHDDPDRAMQLLSQAKDESAAGLAELRSLVRGIRPPVLADRGLVDAIRAIAADMPVPVVVTSTLSGRLAAPLESALYFAAAEVLTNALKHSGAARVGVTLTETPQWVSLVVTDDGRGGAQSERSSGGLAGIRRRLRTFDGALAVSSPDGGPTVVTITAPRILATRAHDATGRTP